MRLHVCVQWPLVIRSYFPALYANKHVHPFGSQRPNDVVFSQSNYTDGVCCQCVCVSVRARERERDGTEGGAELINALYAAPL